MLSAELIIKVYCYLHGEIALEDFERWLVPRLPLLLSLPSSLMSDLVATIELGLAEMSSGALSEEAFRGELKEFMDKNTSLTMFAYPALEVTSTSATYDLIRPSLTLDEFSVRVEVR